MKSRCLDDKASATNTITVMESDERRSTSGEISSSTSNLPEDQSNSILKANAHGKTHHSISIANRIEQLNPESFEDTKELKTILKELFRRIEELYKNEREQPNDIQQLSPNVSARSGNIPKAFLYSK